MVVSDQSGKNHAIKPIETMNPEEIKKVVPSQPIDTSAPEEMTGTPTQQEIDRDLVRVGRKQAKEDENSVEPEKGI